MPGYSKKAMYQTKPTEEVATAEERFVEQKPVVIDLDVVYKVLVIAMLAYVVAKLNKFV